MKKKSFLSSLVQQPEFILIVLILVICVYLSNYNEGFMTATNWKSMSRGFTIEAFVLIGMTFLLITGVFDISVASVMAFAGYVFTSFAKDGMSLFLAFLLAVLVGGLIGLINGLIVTKLEVNPFITTLATMTIVRSLVLAISQGNPVRMVDQAFTSISSSTIGGVPIIFIVFVILAVVIDIMLRKVRWFRQLYFIGGNQVSAELTGINVDKIRVILYITIGALAAVAGCLSSSRLGGSIPTAYAGLEMQLLLACVIGGCSLNGGSGTMLGAVLGLAFLSLLDNGMVMMGIDIYWFDGILGVFLIAVVLINTFSASSVERQQRKAREQGRHLPAQG
ncbi:MAG: ABC transporter permease [Bacillota bacterium]|nr:ABC transporter permease [Bacillota bacterium]